MYYTVREVASYAGVTIKTLYHYHKIGLLEPCELTEAGYRLYSMKGLEKLQQILFYRELDISLGEIKQVLSNDQSRIDCLQKQKRLLQQRIERTNGLLETIEESIIAAEAGEEMDQLKMFNGLSKTEWQEALAEHNVYLKINYNFDLEQDGSEINATELNELAGEPEFFMRELASMYRRRLKPNDKRVQQLLEQHISYIDENLINMDANAFVAEAQFFVDDDFHRDILENMQEGLSYFLYTAAVMYAKENAKDGQ